MTPPSADMIVVATGTGLKCGGDTFLYCNYEIIALLVLLYKFIFRL
jgi:hypothetical protein